MSTFVLAVDHRNSLRGWLRGLGIPDQRLEPSARQLKLICVTALGIARERLPAGARPMLLLDAEYGVDAIPAAAALGLPIVIPVERSGQPEFLFEHGERFAEEIERVAPAAVKALVRYNPAGDAELNRRSRERLVRLQSRLRASGRRFMLELLVPATEQQLAAGAERFDEELRPALAIEAISQLAAEGLRPDWWKLEGNRDRDAAAALSRAAADAAQIGCLVLGRGQDRESVLEWVRTAAAAGGFVGFAVGRTLWTGPFTALVNGQLDEVEAAARIADAYLEIAAQYTAAQPATAGSDGDR